MPLPSHLPSTGTWAGATRSVWPHRDTHAESDKEGGRGAWGEGVVSNKELSEGVEGTEEPASMISIAASAWERSAS
jgi:hypothetical protein